MPLHSHHKARGSSVSSHLLVHTFNAREFILWTSIVVVFFVFIMLFVMFVRFNALPEMYVVKAHPETEESAAPLRNDPNPIQKIRLY